MTRSFRTTASAQGLTPLLILAVALSACAKSNDTDGQRPLEVKDAWVRATNVTASAAMYLTLENHDSTTVQILGVGSSDARVAELHESSDSSGVSRMQHLDSLAIAPRATLTMQPGGVHIMLIDLARSVVKGDTVMMTLHLGDGRTTRVKAVARDETP